ncbi:hypothetical protein GCM10009646_81830 [Streptomyces aureus]
MQEVGGAMMPWAWEVRNCRQVGPERCGAESMPAAWRISQTVDEGEESSFLRLETDTVGDGLLAVAVADVLDLDIWLRGGRVHRRRLNSRADSAAVHDASGSRLGS